MSEEINGIVYGKKDLNGKQKISELFEKEKGSITLDDDGFPNLIFVSPMDESLVKSRLEEADLSSGARLTNVDKSGATTMLVVGPKF